MSQTPTQRRREIDDARRRNISATLEHLVRENPECRRLANETAGALLVLSGDELALVELLAARIAMMASAPGVRVLVDAMNAIAAIVSRMLRGRASYGELTIDSDPRDYELERDEELADAVIYDALCGERERRQMGLNALPGELHLVALDRVGRHAQLPALVRNVQDRERPEPFAIPPPWCLGSALLFQLLAVRIENNTAVAVRCHQCGTEWSLADQELRLTGSGQYVIPTHVGKR